MWGFWAGVSASGEKSAVSRVPVRRCWGTHQCLGWESADGCVGKGAAGSGGRVRGRDRAGVGLDGSSAGMGRECWSGEKGEMRCRVVVDAGVLGKGVK